MPPKCGAKRKAVAVEATAAEEIRPSPKPPVSAIWGEVTKLLVGPNKVEFNVHKSLLVAQSPFFAAQNKPCWIKADSGIDLGHVTVEGFEIVVSWLYSKQLPAAPVKLQEEEHSDWTEYLQMFEAAYKTADQLMMTAMQDQLLDNLKQNQARAKKLPHYSTLLSICKADLTHTPYYKFVLKDLTWRFMNRSFNDGRLERFNEGLEQLMKYPTTIKDWLAQIAAWRNKAWSDPNTSGDCEYHSHGDNEECYLRKPGIKKEELDQPLLGHWTVTA